MFSVCVLDNERSFVKSPGTRALFFSWVFQLALQGDELAASSQTLLHVHTQAGGPSLGLRRVLTKSGLPPSGASRAPRLGQLRWHPLPVPVLGRLVSPWGPAAGQPLLEVSPLMRATCSAPAPTSFPGHGLLDSKVNKSPAALGCKRGWP